MKKVLFILITFFTCFSVNAAVKTKEREDDNYGLIKTVNASEEDILKTPFVDYNEKVYDFADILTDSNIKDLKDQANKFINKTNIDLVLVTLNEDISKEDVKKFSKDFYNYNDFGIKSTNYDGIEIIININSSNRFLYIISFGDPSYLKQDDLQKVLDGVYDSFNKDIYYSGFHDFIKLVDEYYEENKSKIINSNKLSDLVDEYNRLNYDKIIGIREGLSNYGVNKPAKIDSVSTSHILKTPLVDSNDKVYDFSDVLTEEQEEDLRKKSKEFLNRTGIELVIVTINQQYSDSAIEEFADEFFDFNDFGISENSKSYDGILAIRNTDNYNRYYYISTSGTGQIYFPENRVEDILDDMYDNMHIDNYYYGFLDFIESANENYDKGVPSKYKGCYVDEMGDLFDKDGNPVSWEKGIYRVPFILASIVSLVVSLIFISILIVKNKMVKKAVDAKDYLDENSVNYTKKQDTFVSTHTSSYRISSSSGGGGGSHHSSGGFSHGGGGRHC